MEVNVVLDAKWRGFSLLAVASRLRRSAAHAIRTGAERIARERLRRSSRELDQQLLQRIDRLDPATAREIRKLFGL